MKAKKLGNYTSNDIELCRTTNHNVEREAVEMLLQEQISFSRNSRRIPFFQREKYHGASQVYVISTHPGEYGKARRALDKLDKFYRTKLVLSNF